MRAQIDESGVLFTAQRSFSLWKYGVGHSQLLIRSVPSGSQEFCMDIKFEGVAAVKLAAKYNGVAIRLVPEEESARLCEYAGVPPKWRSELVAISLGLHRGSDQVLCQSVSVLYGGSDPIVVDPRDQEVLWQYEG
ncbi:hypothetical protein AB0I60_05685 [Actinosynnema sp. NPDC050436]|uniref:hypothetical protein n=1 Tax=Actinosynnema sp. NPDC050436 TaxID=3155659 RepID=UPI0033FF5438